MPILELNVEKSSLTIAANTGHHTVGLTIEEHLEETHD